MQGEIEQRHHRPPPATRLRALRIGPHGRRRARARAGRASGHPHDVPPETLRRRINDELPTDINILLAEKVRHKFHARHDAIGRTYIYQVSRRRTAFAKPFVWWVKEDLDLARMQAAAARFVGFHDFKSFSDADPREGSTEVMLEALDIREDGDLIVFRVDGRTSSGNWCAGWSV